MTKLSRVCVVVFLGLGLVLGAGTRAYAVPFTITANLTGDSRSGNPDNLLVHVTINGDTMSNVTTWLVDLDSASSHPNMKLGAFAFNLAGVSLGNLSFSAITPSGWTFTNGNNVPGSGGADFLVETNDPSGSSNNVTNAVPLAFTLTRSGGNWSTSMFLNAPIDDGGAIPGPGTQLGAHLQSLSTAGCWKCSDSGFASGNYSMSTQSVPEPASLALFGMGLVALSIATRRR